MIFLEELPTRIHEILIDDILDHSSVRNINMNINIGNTDQMTLIFV